jgi:hypothetical protein
VRFRDRDDSMDSDSIGRREKGERETLEGCVVG